MGHSNRVPNPPISVAMCSFNSARFLGEQLESIAGQTRLPYELVICDDGSTDRTLEMVKEYAGRVPFPVRVEINKTNLGTTKNFEKAIGLCRGELIALSDSDDVWKPNKLEVMHEIFQAQPGAGYIFSNAELIDEKGALIQSSLWSGASFRRWRVAEFTQANQVAMLLWRALITGATMIFRADLRSAVVPFSPYLIHDYWITLVLSCLGFYGIAVTEPLIAYRQHQAQMLGVRKRTPLEKIKYPAESKAFEHKQRQLGYQDLRARLIELAAAGWSFPGRHLALLEEGLAHCRSRTTAHESRGFPRIKTVLNETATGRYRRFSNSWQSVIQDLCF